MSAGLYVHFPFCNYLCNYCDYFKVRHSEQDEIRYFKALNTETKLVAREFGNLEFATIFVGGGTPSLANLNLFQNWIDVLNDNFSISAEAEFSIECNPDTVTTETLAALKKLGVNRPSLGVQSLNPELLQLISRRHTPHQSNQAAYFVNTLDYPSYNVDLLFGLPGQSSDMLSNDVSQLIDLKPPHISFYQLTVEQGTPLYADVAEGKTKMPDDDLVAAMFRSGCEEFTKAGYEHYEVSSFAQMGHQCRHNLNYWEGGDYIGLGPSAHSYFNGRCCANVANLNEYIDSLEENEIPRVTDEPWLLQRAAETVASGLRLKCGINRSRFAERFGLPLNERLNLKEYNTMIESGVLIDDDGTLRVSDEGIYMADEIAGRLLK